MNRLTSELLNVIPDLIIPGHLLHSTRGRLKEIQTKFPDTNLAEYNYENLEKITLQFGEIGPLVIGGLWAIISTAEVIQGKIDASTAVENTLGMYAFSKLPSYLVYKNLALDTLEKVLSDRKKET